jgi:uncharacterized protein YggE
MYNKLKISILCVLGLVSSSSVMAQVSGNYQQDVRGNMMLGANNQKVQLPITLPENIQILQAEILYNAKPTHYLAIFALTQEGESIAQTDTFINQRLETFKRGLRAVGIFDTDIYVDFISLIPKYEVQVEKKRRSKTANEIPLGFQLKKNIHIQFSDSRLMDKIISAAAVAEIYDMAKVEVDISDTKKLHEEMAEEAMKIIAIKAKRYAPLNIKTTPLSMGENFETYYPTEQYETYSAYAADYSQIQSNQSFAQNKMSVKYGSKDKTVFYNRLPYDQFDLVINPNFVEPPIQIHYKVQVKYAIENTELTAKREVEMQKQKEKEESIRKDEVEIRKIQAANPPKTCCDKN